MPLSAQETKRINDIENAVNCRIPVEDLKREKQDASGFLNHIISTIFPKPLMGVVIKPDALPNPDKDQDKDDQDKDQDKDSKNPDQNGGND